MIQDKRKFKFQLTTVFLVIIVFSLFNFSMYMLLTRRLSNNFSNTSQAKMVDVEKYLPFNEKSDLVRINSSLKLTDNLPVLDGAAALVPVYASIIENVYPEGSVTYEGGTFSDDNFYGENFAKDSKMQYKNTVRGYKAIVDGETDILFCASPSEDQIKYAKEQGVELEYVPIGLEAFVFFVNKNCPIDNLTSEQIRNIYSGEIKNWSEVGGPNRIINPVSRLEGSGSQSMMNRFMKGKNIDNKSAFAVTGASIGFSFRYYMDGIVGDDNVKMISLNGIYPNEENIQNGSYPVIAEFYAIYRKDNKNENISILIDWILSKEGQKIINEIGYVSIN